MLGGTDQALGQRALGHRKPGVTRQDRVLRVIFAVTAVVGMAVQVQAGTPDKGQAVIQRIVAPKHAVLFCQFLVEGGGHQRRTAHIVAHIGCVGVILCHIPGRVGVGIGAQFHIEPVGGVLGILAAHKADGFHGGGVAVALGDEEDSFLQIQLVKQVIPHGIVIVLAPHGDEF